MLDFFFPFSFLTVALTFARCPTKAHVKRLDDCVMLLFLSWSISLPRHHPQSREKRKTLDRCIKNLAYLKRACLLM